VSESAYIETRSPLANIFRLNFILKDLTATEQLELSQISFTSHFSPG